MSEQIVPTNRRRIQQVGGPEDLYERPANRFVADFIGETNLLCGSVRSVDGESAMVTTEKGVQIRIPASTGVSPGQIVHLALRPEGIFFLDEERAGMNAQVGLEEEAIYLAELIKYVVTVGTGEGLQLKQPN